RSSPVEIACLATSINEKANSMGAVTIYPNPANAENVFVDYFTEESAATNVVLKDLMGKQLLNIDESAYNGFHSVKIPVAFLRNGIYFVSIYSNGICNKTLKLVK
ncbi:MAG TPA: T9SS type A sorting domain-containing protein, partial [Chitinophagaceae bacterium]|nr:T9SS type A sorting domain-containing protein [Chitinophagaceae bacterium]